MLSLGYKEGIKIKTPGTQTFPDALLHPCLEQIDRPKKKSKKCIQELTLFHSWEPGLSISYHQVVVDYMQENRWDYTQQNCDWAALESFKSNLKGPDC